MSLLLCSTNLFGSKPDTIPLRGADTAYVVIPIETIKRANIKLIERNALISICEVQQDMINDYKTLIDKEKINAEVSKLKQDSLVNIILKQQQINASLTEKSKIRLYVSIGASVVAIGLLISLFYVRK